MKRDDLEQAHRNAEIDLMMRLGSSGPHSPRRLGKWIKAQKDGHGLWKALYRLVKDGRISKSGGRGPAVIYSLMSAQPTTPRVTVKPEVAEARRRGLARVYSYEKALDRVAKLRADLAKAEWDLSETRRVIADALDRQPPAVDDE